MKGVCLAAALTIGVAAAPLGAQPASSRDLAGGHVPTVTRLVKLFLERESTLADSIRGGDTAALEKQLADNFELRTGARAASPVPRDEFVRAMMRTRDPGGDIGRMAVHDLGGTAIVSFTQASAGGMLFVVDVWRQQANDWQLAVRYASPAGDTTFTVPGTGPAVPEIPKKY